MVRKIQKQINEDVLDFSQSLTIDIVLYEADILVTEAHVEMLSKCGHITQKEQKNKSWSQKITAAC